MPLHAQSIMSEEEENKFYKWILAQGVNSNITYVNEKGIVLYTNELIDKFTDQLIGKIVYTFKVEDLERAPKILDIDMVLKNENATDLYFKSMISKSSEANEYYEAVTTDGNGHFELETVDRHMFEGTVHGTIQKVYLSAFPWQAEIYDNIRELNYHLGITDEYNFYFAETFMAPSSIAGRDYADETYTLFIGKIVDFRKVAIDGPEKDIEFTIIDLDTQLGRIPLAINLELAGLKDLAPGKILMVYADIKADFNKC